MLLEDIYNKKYNENLIKIANERKIKDNIKNIYSSCKEQLNNNMSLEEFALYTYGANPGRSGIGELSQIEKLKEKYPTITKLNQSGHKSIRLNLSNNNEVYISECSKSNIGGIKSFDAIARNENIITVFILKCVDLGEYSKSKGGGHQDNVLNELIKTINIISDKSLMFDNKDVLVHIVIDGRSSTEFITKCKKVSENSNIKITDSNNA